MTQITLKLDDSLVEGIGKDKIEQKIGFINIRESKHLKKQLMIFLPLTSQMTHNGKSPAI